MSTHEQHPNPWTSLAGKEHPLTREREATILLLESRHDWQPVPRSQFSTFGAVPGEQPTHPKRCGTCQGTGLLNVRTRVEKCEVCDGNGSYLVDAYTGQRTSAAGGLGVKLTRVERARLRDAELARLGFQLARPREIRTAADLEGVAPFAWERDRDRHYRHGDYRMLDLALEWLAGVFPNRRQLISWTYEQGILAASAASAAAVDVLCERMPSPVRVPPWVAQHGGAARIAAKFARSAA